MIDENLVIENLNELLTNSVTLTSRYYDIFINPEPMDVTLWMYNEDNELIEVTIPNRAKDRMSYVAYDGKLTIQRNGVSVGDFTANSQVDKTINVVVPTKTSQLENDAEFVSVGELPTIGNGRITINQSGVSKGSFTVNQNTNTTIDLDTSVNIDESSITVNENYALQASGVIDQNGGGTIKKWTGTRAAFDAIVNKDPDTIYEVTDDTDITASVLEVLYPIGSIYIGTMSVCPLQTLGIGTWQLIAADKVLQGSGTKAAGSTVEAGLPNITGSFSTARGSDWGGTNTTGAFTAVDEGGSHGYGGSKGCKVSLDASLSSSIYGNSTTVQPPAYVVNIWQRTS